MVFVQRKLRLSTRSLRTIVRTELACFPVRVLALDASIVSLIEPLPFGIGTFITIP